MQKLKSDYFNPVFSHIYVEKRIKEHPRTQDILSKLASGAERIEIDHYKDVFCRKGQSSRLQRHTQNLVLAARDEKFFYPGAAVCQSFGHENFYYTSCMMNCIYDCAYCYLKGMYPSANIVVFVNIEEIFDAAEKMLEQFPMYVCVSYDTDLLALEWLTGYAGAWHEFAAGLEGKLIIEIRTKCANKQYFRSRKPQENVIYAFTLSPQEVIEAYERHTPSLKQRIDCVSEAIDQGFAVRLCFDPMIYMQGWRQSYDTMLEEVFRCVDKERIVDVSAGSFRIPGDYLKNMRKQEPDNAAAWFPYEQENGICHYPADIMDQMESHITVRLKERLPAEKIFTL